MDLVHDGFLDRVGDCEVDELLPPSLGWMAGEPFLSV
jgi:hypothetical protein